jgi:hypothetical protein
MSTSTDLANGDSELRGRKPQVSANDEETVIGHTSDFETKKPEKQQRTWGRTPDGTGT